MRRWLQFRMSTLLWLIVACANAFGWWRDHEAQRRTLQQSELRRQALWMAHRDRMRQMITSPQLLLFADDADVTVEPFYKYSSGLAFYKFASGLSPPSSGSTIIARPDTIKPDEGAVESLIKLLADKDAKTRARAARTLGAFGKEAKAAAPELLNALEDRDKTVRHHAIWALGRLGEDAAKALPSLTAIMHSDSSELAGLAAQAVRRLNPKADITPQFVELLRHANADTRRRAAAELGVGGDRAKVAVSGLISLLEDPNPEVRRAGALAVSKLAPRDEALQTLTLAFGNEADQAAKLHLALLLAELDEPEE